MVKLMVKLINQVENKIGTIWDHPFSMYVNFTEKLIFLTFTCVYACVSGGNKC